MNAPPLVPKEAFRVLLTGPRAPVWWGMVLLIAIETTVFATLFSGYFYLRFSAPEWPPAGIPPPGLLLPLVNTGILFSSSVAVLIASSGIKQGNVRRLKWGMGIGIVLEIAFFVIKIMLENVEYGWTDHAYASVFFTINRLHTGHVLVAILVACVAQVLAMRGYFTRERRLGVQAVNLYWQFVAVIWVPVLFVLFFIPRWF